MNESSAPDAAQAAAPLSLLEQPDAFVARHIGTTPEDQAAMLAVLGAPTRAALMEAIVPAAIRRAKAMALPGPVPEAARSRGSRPSQAGTRS